MNNQNFGNPNNLTPEQQQQQQWAQYQAQYSYAFQQQAQFYPQQQFFTPPAGNFDTPPPPPDDRPPLPEPSSNPHNSGNNQRGGFNQNRGRNNKQNWKGNQRGGHKGGGNFSSGQNQFGNSRDSSQNKGSLGNNNKQNQNRNWNQPPGQSRNVLPPSAQNVSNNPPLPSTSSSSQAPPKQIEVSAAFTQEELEFDEQFKKWQNEFDNWKKANVNHPDKNAYRQYEQQFETVRQKLLQRREEMQRRKLELQQLMNPPKTQQQMEFESQWKAETIKPATTLVPPPEPMKFKSTQPQPSTSSSNTGGFLKQPQPSTSNEFANDVDFAFDEKKSPTSKNFTASQVPTIESIVTVGSDEEDVSFKNIGTLSKSFDARPTAFTSGLGIMTPTIPTMNFPGLDVPLVETRYEPEDNFEYIEDDDDDCLPIDNSFRDDPPPLPPFRESARQAILDMKDLLEPPGRTKRHDRILILIRGAPGSGKSFLANLIIEREKFYKNNRCKFISIHKPTRRGFNRESITAYQENLVQELRDTIKEEICTFLVIEVEGGKSMYFNKFVHIATILGQFKCYSINMQQPIDVCLKYNINKRSYDDIQATVQDMQSNTVSFTRTILLDPSYLLITDIHRVQIAAEEAKKKENMTDLASNIAQLLQNKSVMELLQSQLTQQPPKALMSEAPPTSSADFVREQSSEMSTSKNFVSNFVQNSQNFGQNQSFNQVQSFNQNPQTFGQNFGPNNQKFVQNFPQQNFNQENFEEELPVFTPAKIIDYKHVHLPTFEEQLMEFRVFRVIDYNHQATRNLQEYVKDIDVDRIIDKRKAVALRKKILEYLKNAERPEDTVSNPKYPRNWEVIVPENRPPLRNKRKKKMTPKIRRIKMMKMNEMNWKDMGYVAPNNGNSMDLEEISSDEDDHMGEDKNVVETKTITQPVVIDDPFKDVPKTTPEFNHFKHPNVKDIKELLYCPWRAKRPERIMIIMRGAPGSGKTHLARLIRKKEVEMTTGSSELRIISINDYEDCGEDEDSDSDDDDNSVSQMRETYLHQMLKMVRSKIKENIFKFLVIDAENCDLRFYNDFYKEGSLANYEIYTIELYQTADRCRAQLSKNKNSKKASAEIERNIELLEKNRIPADHVLLNPSILYSEYKCFINPDVRDQEKFEKGDFSMDVDDELPTSSSKLEPSNTKKLQEFIEFPPVTLYNPRVPQFNFHNRKIVDIRNILEEPGRSQRAEKIAIILRGSSGAGKTYLSGLIKSKEAENGCGETFISISIDDYSINPLTNQFQYCQADRDKSLAAMIKSFKEIVRKSSHKFIVIDAENGALEDYKEFHDIASGSGFQCFAIELHQEISICARDNSHDRSAADIESVLDDINLNPIPEDHILLDPSYLYLPGESSSLSETRPLKPAIKPSAINFQKEFSARLKQPLMVNGKIIERNLSKPKNLPEFNWHNNDHIVDLREILELPERLKRADKIVIILRGVPGSGKSYLAALIERKEAELGNRENFKLISIDETYERDQEQEIFINGIKKLEVVKVSNFEESKLDTYMEATVKSFKTAIESGLYKFIVVDADCCELMYYNQFYDIAKSNEFTIYTIEMNQELSTCLEQNDHQRDPSVIQNKIDLMLNAQTPVEHTLLDPEYLYDEYDYLTNDEAMNLSENGSDDEMISDEEKSAFGPLKKSAQSSKWDDDEDNVTVIDRLDGTRNKHLERVTMADYLRTEDEWTMRPSTSGKKRVRWADIEEKKQQERMREVGFIVGQTDWTRMTDTSDGRSALEKTKYIEPRMK